MKTWENIPFFLTQVNLLVISQCQTDAEIKFISFPQEWLDYERVSHSYFVISTIANAFLEQQLCGERKDHLKGQIILFRTGLHHVVSSLCFVLTCFKVLLAIN